jgi:4-amino-4-deoxy-L-arabinose transferase-like glycosyltransferase
MAQPPRFSLWDLLLFVVILALAAGVRSGYLLSCADAGRAPGPLRVQAEPPPLRGIPPGTKILDKENPTDFDLLVHNLKESNWFGSLAPLAPKEEQTAHTSPGYPWLISAVARVLPPEQRDFAVRWLQCLLGTLTAGFYFLFARRAFQSRTIAGLAGLFTALHPFWIINTASINDGVLTCFLLSVVLLLGVRASQTGGPISSLLFGLGLAGLALVRAALLPFSFLAMAWLLLRSRSLQGGWLCALVAFLGFAIGLAPWTVRNVQVFGEPLPVVDSAYLHLWAGNNPQADGGPLTESMLAGLPPELEQIEHQPERYARLGASVKDEVLHHPVPTLQRRFQAALAFFLGKRWFSTRELAEEVPGTTLPAWLWSYQELALTATLFGLFALGILGWRWTHAWRTETVPATLAVLWIPLPYIIGHAEALSGPRLPIDGILFCYAAYVLACLLPGGQALSEGPQEQPAEEF